MSGALRRTEASCSLPDSCGFAPAPRVLRLLVIDDSEVDRRLVRRTLQSAPYFFDIVEAGDATTGMELAATGEYDCILLDYRLPEMDGTEVLVHLLSERRRPVIMLTGHGDESIAADAIKKGAQDYLNKRDISVESLTRSVEGAIEKVTLLNERDRWMGELEHRNDELMTFAKAICSDLREPLRTVVSFCGLLKQRYAGYLDEQAQGQTAQVIVHARRMSDMIDSLMDFARAGHGESAVSTTDMGRVLDVALDNLQFRIQESGATVTATDLPVVRCDGIRMTLVFQNLIENAIKYRGATAPRIHVSAQKLPPDAPERRQHHAPYRNGEIWKFCVADNGIGIDPRYQEIAFHPFRQLNAPGEFEGSGIGLSLCRKVIESHHGIIWFESEPKLGSRFYFTLPG